MRSSSLFIAVCLFLVSGCQGTTSPRGSPSIVTHPTGNAGLQITGLNGRPFAIRVTNGGDVLVTEQELNLAVRTDSLGGQAVSIGVGGYPADVIVNSTERRPSSAASRMAPSPPWTSRRTS